MRRFTIVALAVAIVLATASRRSRRASPDGLEKVAERQGFADRGRLAPVQESAPVPDYAFPGVEDARLATALAGLAGALGVLRASAPAWRGRPPAARGMSGSARARRRPGSPAIRRAGCTGSTPARSCSASPGSRSSRRRRRASAWPLLACCAALLAGVALAARVPARVIARRALVVLPLVALAAASLPFLRHGGAEHALGPLTVSDAGLAVFGTADRQGRASARSARCCSPRPRRFRRRSTGCGGCTRRRCSWRSPASCGATCSCSPARSGACAPRSPPAATARATCCTAPRPGGSPARCSCARTPARSGSTRRWPRAAGTAFRRRRPPRRSRAPTSLSSPRSPASRSLLRVALELGA